MPSNIESYEQIDIRELFKTYADFLQSIYEATKTTLSFSFRVYLDSILKFPKFGNKLVSQLVFFLNNPTEYRNTQRRRPRQLFADDYSRYSKQLFKLYNSKIIFEVFRHKETIEQLIDPIKTQISKQNVRLVNAFDRYFYECCDSSVLNLYYLTCYTDFEDAKYRDFGEESSRQLYLQLQDIRKLIENSIDLSEPDPLIRNKHLWPSLFLEPENNKLLSEKFKQLGYFPFFLALNLSLLSSDDKGTFIFLRCSNIFVEENVKSLSDIAKQNDLTRERVRQIRLKHFNTLRNNIVKLSKTGCLEEYKYNAARDYDLKNIASREGVPFNSNFIVWVVCQIDNRYKLLGNVSNAFFASSKSNETLYAVPRVLCDSFDFKKFIKTIENQLREKHYYEERIELEQFVSRLFKESTDTEIFYEIVKECRNILERGYPDIIVNSQIVFSVNAHKPIPILIEDLLREFDRPMNVDEIMEQLHARFPDIELTPSKIRSALRNNNIVAISRTSTYALSEWNQTEKRGGTIRELAAEYLKSLTQPIATLSEICDYIAKFRDGVKESSVKANLLAEANNLFCLYLKDDKQFIGLTDGHIDDEYVKQDKRQERRTFSDSIERLESFIKKNGRFPYSSGVDEEESRLFRFYNVSLGYLRKGALSVEEAAEIERITSTYGHLKIKKERVSWDEWLERFVKYITENNALPIRSSREYAWYEENKALFEAGQLTPDQTSAFAFLNKIVSRMS